MTTKHATVPVSVKLRACSKRLLDRTLPDDFGYLYEFIDGLFEAGASWITLHPRMAEQGRRGSADWGLIRKLKARFHSQGKTRVIIGNGDIQCHEDIQEMFDVSDCDRAMIGRALIVKPWLMRNEPEPDAYAQGELYGKFLMRVLDNMIAHYEVSAGLRRMKFLVVSGKAWVEYGEFLYGRTMAARTYEELKTSYEKFFSSRQKIVKRTELRS